MSCNLNCVTVSFAFPHLVVRKSERYFLSEGSFEGLEHSSRFIHVSCPCTCKCAYMYMHVESVLSLREVVFVSRCSLGVAVWSIVRGMSRRGASFQLSKEIATRL